MTNEIQPQDSPPQDTTAGQAPAKQVPQSNKEVLKDDTSSPEPEEDSPVPEVPADPPPAPVPPKKANTPEDETDASTEQAPKEEPVVEAAPSIPAEPESAPPPTPKASEEQAPSAPAEPDPVPPPSPTPTPKEGAPAPVESQDSIAPLQNDNITVVGAPGVNHIVKPVLSFLDKLKELRTRANKVRHEKVEENLKKIMEYARKKQKVTNDDVEGLTGVGDARAKQYLQILEKQGKLMQIGKTKNTFYKPRTN